MYQNGVSNYTRQGVITLNFNHLNRLKIENEKIGEKEESKVVKISN